AASRQPHRLRPAEYARATRAGRPQQGQEPPPTRPWLYAHALVRAWHASTLLPAQGTFREMPMPAPRPLCAGLGSDRSLTNAARAMPPARLKALRLAIGRT